MKTLASKGVLITQTGEFVSTPLKDIEKDDVILLRIKGAHFHCEYVEIYGFSFAVSVNQTDRELLVDLKKQWSSVGPGLLEAVVDHTSTQKSHTARAFMSHDPVLDLAMIRLYDCMGSALDFDSLVHEIFHATHHLLRNRGMSLSLKSEEAYAYLAGFMMRRVMETIQYQEPKAKKQTVKEILDA